MDVSRADNYVKNDDLRICCSQWQQDIFSRRDSNNTCAESEGSDQLYDSSN